jgi:predicted alpha/beta-hydrolase family hydrolase
LTERRLPFLLEGTPGSESTATVYTDRSTQGPSPAAAFVLAHGAGAGQQSTFIVDFARALAASGIDVVTFDFPYIVARKRIPDRGPVLEACYRAVIALARGEVPSAGRALFIGGKSMGGRIATQVAAADSTLPIRGLILLGYPLHPPGRFDQRRDAHLPAIRRPMLFVQGSRDTFGTPPELEPVLARISPAPRLHVVSDGDHSFKLPRRNPAAQAAVYAGIQQAIVDWIRGVA